MPGPPLSNIFDGGTLGAAITPGNSALPDAFQAVNGTCVYDDTHVAHGDRSMKTTEGATFAAHRAIWTGLGSLTVPVFCRFYLWLPSLTGLNNTMVCRFTNNAAAQCSQLSLQATTGILRCQNAANSSIAASAGAVAPATSQWIRIEFRVLASTTAGEVEWRLFNAMDSTTADDTKLATGQVLAANADQLEIGISNQGPTNVDWWWDEFAVSTVDWIGPAVPPEAPVIDPDYSNFPKHRLRR